MYRTLVRIPKKKKQNWNKIFKYYHHAHDQVNSRTQQQVPKSLKTSFESHTGIIQEYDFLIGISAYPHTFTTMCVCVRVQKH